MCAVIIMFPKSIHAGKGGTAQILPTFGENLTLTFDLASLN